ncbi:MAG: peptidylprolyl isomerase, partial [Pseudomonadota bacterium]
ASRAAGLIGPNEPLSHRAAFERGLVEAYVEQRVLAEAALREGAHRDPGVRDRLLAARDRILAAAFLDRRVSEAATPAAARAIFDAQSPAARLGDEVDARHIVVATKKEAENIVVALNGGADFAALARARSLDDATGPRGGRIGYFARSMMTPGLARAAFATPVGALAPPFETDYGWHVLEVLDRRAGRAPTFEDAREGVQRFLADRAIETGVAAAFERASTDYYPPPPRDDGSDPETGAAPGASETAAPQSASIEGLNN